MPISEGLPAPLRPYGFHGLDLNYTGGDHATAAECPWCGKGGGKFRVNATTGLWDCKSCLTEGNTVQFLRKLWESGLTAPDSLARLAEDRGLRHPETLATWGVRQSPLTREWVVPGYSAGGRLVQLYRYAGPRGARRLLATPSYAGPDGRPVGSGLFGEVAARDRDKPTVYVCEGPWDGMVLAETLASAKELEVGGGGGGEGGGSLRRLVVTGNPDVSLGAAAAVVAVPGCGMWLEEWGRVAAGRNVVFTYDSDHPRMRCPTCRKSWSVVSAGRSCPACKVVLVPPLIPPSGYTGALKAGGLLKRQVPPPASVAYLRWGGEGYDPARKHGYDLRDWLGGVTGVGARVAELGRVLSLVEPLPIRPVNRPGGGPLNNGRPATPGGTELTPLECKDWRTLEAAWRKAMKWRPGLGDVLSVMVAVAVSTEQAGDQLFLQVIGDAGSGKTRFCDGMLVSRGCYPLEHLTGFHSGWSDGSGEDFSLIARINRKTLITPEGDVMMSSPRFAEIMSQQRRIFDGTSGASFKNKKTDMRYTGLRTPWIIAGTPALMESDQSRLGDRFLRVCVDRPTDEEKEDILLRVGHTAWRLVAQTSNCDPAGHTEDLMTTAYRLTGGYVDYLRANASDLLANVGAPDGDEAAVVRRCMHLAEFTADFRARPSGNAKQDAEDYKELPSRLTHQYVRLAKCLAAATGHATVDDEVMRRVTRVAVDTARGRTLTLAGHVYAEQRKGGSPTVTGLARKTGMTEDRVRTLLRFLLAIGVMRQDYYGADGRLLGRPRWRLTNRSRDLYRAVMVLGQGQGPKGVAGADHRG